MIDHALLNPTLTIAELAGGHAPAIKAAEAEQALTDLGQNLDRLLDARGRLAPSRFWRNASSDSAEVG